MVAAHHLTPPRVRESDLVRLLFGSPFLEGEYKAVPPDDIQKYRDDQPRDDHGRWSGMGGGDRGLAAKFADMPISHGGGYMYYDMVNPTPSAKQWCEAHADDYKNDRDFRLAACGIVRFTGGEYDQIRQASLLNAGVEHRTGASRQETGWSEAELRTRYPDMDGRAAVEMGLKQEDYPGAHSAVDEARAMQNAIAGAKDDSPTLYRGGWVTEGKVLGAPTPQQPDTWTPPEVGSAFNMVGLSSFTSDPDVARRFSTGMDEGQEFWGEDKPPAISYVYEVEAGARSLPAAALSIFDQSEYITSGQFEVMGVDHQTFQHQTGNDTFVPLERYTIHVRQVAVWVLK